MMDLYTLSFYLIGGFILGTALLSVTSRKIFRSAIWLLFSLAGIGALYFWMDMQFLAAVQVIVYVGGVVVLIIFSIFLTQQSGSDLPVADKNRKLISFALSAIGAAMMLMMVRNAFYIESTVSPDASLSTIGKSMLSTEAGGFALPFELISVLLLAAMIGCIVIGLKPSKE